MGFKETWNKYFDNHAESRDRHWDPALRTHYFKTSKDKAFQTVINYFENLKGANLHAKSEHHGEISVNYKGKRKAFVIATIVMAKPFRTAIDFSVTTEGGLFDLGFSHNLIKKLYADMKNELQIVDADNNPY